MVDERRVRCAANKGLADYVLKKKREEDAARPKGLSEHLERTFVRAYRNVCDAKDSIDTLKDLSQIKGFGKWMVKLMQGYFVIGDESSEQEDLPGNRAGIGKKAKGKKPYRPQIKTAAYALLITLHRETANGKKFMRKQELMDATEASGLSQVPIVPEKGKGKAGIGQSKREWYSGWSCMTTLIHKGLVVKSSNPAKYMLTVEGHDAANECIVRSRLSNPVEILSDDEVEPAQQAKRPHNQDSTYSITMRKEQPYVDARSRAQSFIPAGPSRAQACQVDLEGSRAKKFRSCNVGSTLNPCSSGSSHPMKACSSSLASNGTEGVTTIPRLPPLRFGEVFEEAYDVIMILDDREQFATKGSRSIVDNICSVFKIKIEVRRLPIGDCIWIARHKYQQDEYVLDFIVERKSIDDLHSSIMDNRYKDQKLRLQRSGIKKLIYILEGDPNQSKTSESIKTACFTTEILEGFDVVRTNGLGETLRKYGYLTKSIYQYYKSRVNDDQNKVPVSCPSFDDFVKRCQDFDKMTISDVFAIQLMQVPQVTEEIAIAVLDTYPTLLSLASAYSKLDGNVSAQEEMLRNQSNNVICASASKNIYKLVCGE